MAKKVNYCNQTNLPCYQNSQHWYYINALKKSKTTKNITLRNYYLSVVKYYTNGRINS